MGNKHSKFNRSNLDAKDQKFTQEFIRCVRYGTEKSRDLVQVSLVNGYLVVDDLEIHVVYPKGLLLFCVIKPLSKKLKLYFKNDEIWTFYSQTLNSLLAFRKKLQISMRPVNKNEVCQKCADKGKANCALCGLKWCEQHLKQKMVVGFLGYSNPVKICDKCIEIGMSLEGMINRATSDYKKTNTEQNMLNLRITRSNRLQLIV